MTNYSSSLRLEEVVPSSGFSLRLRVLLAADLLFFLFIKPPCIVVQNPTCLRDCKMPAARLATQMAYLRKNSPKIFSDVARLNNSNRKFKV